MLNHVIIIPGLSNDSWLLRKVVSNWNKFNLTPHILDLKWRVEENGFEIKLKKIINLIDKLAVNGNIISLIGISAGGSAAINAFYLRQKKIFDFISFSLGDCKAR